MKKIISIISIILSLNVLSSISIEKLEGYWSSSCTQSQNSNGNQGYLVETYRFNKDRSYQLDRIWYSDSKCKKIAKKEKESGNFTLGKENTNKGFNPVGTYETQFKHDNKLEQGLLWVSESYSKLRIAKGFGNSQNTMLGLFEYKKH